MKEKSLLPEEVRKMFSSKIIKTDDNEKSEVTDFFLRQLEGCQHTTGAVSGLKKNHRHGEKNVIGELEQLRQDSEKEAGGILENAKREAQKIKRKAQEDGFQQGEKAGLKKGEMEMLTLRETLRSCIQEFKKLKETFYFEHQDIVLDLSFKIAQKVIHQEVSTNKELVVGVMNSAIKMTIDRERLKVRANPADIDVCLRKRPEIIKDIDGIKQIIFEPDENVGKGGAIVEYSFGEIDARLEQQFAEVIKEIEGIHDSTESGA
jgi:flagellar assembly protein FliH